VPDNRYPRGLVELAATVIVHTGTGADIDIYTRYLCDIRNGRWFDVGGYALGSRDRVFSEAKS
jgi:hypothetical protein